MKTNYTGFPTEAGLDALRCAGVGPSYVAVSSELLFQNQVFSELSATFLPVKLES